MNEEKTIADVVKQYRERQGLSQEKLIEALTEGLINVNYTRQAVSRWEKKLDEPNTDFLLLVMMVYADWRMQWAIDMLCAKLPEVFTRDQHGALTTLKQTWRTDQGKKNEQISETFHS